MPKAIGQRIKMVCLLKVLFEETDAEHPITRRALSERLEDLGISSERKTLYHDLQLLRDTLNIDIVTVGKGPRTSYYLASRPFMDEDFRLLSAMVATCPWVSEERAERIQKGLGTLLSHNQASLLHAPIPLRLRSDISTDEVMLMSIDLLNQAIHEQRPVLFYYVVDPDDPRPVPIKAIPKALYWSQKGIMLEGEEITGEPAFTPPPPQDFALCTGPDGRPAASCTEACRHRHRQQHQRQRLPRQHWQQYPRQHQQHPRQTDQHRGRCSGRREERRREEYRTELPGSTPRRAGTVKARRDQTVRGQTVRDLARAHNAVTVRPAPCRSQNPFPGQHAAQIDPRRTIEVQGETQAQRRLLPSAGSTDHAGRTDRADRTGRTDRSDRSDRAGRADRTVRIGHSRQLRTSGLQAAEDPKITRSRATKLWRPWAAEAQRPRAEKKWITALQLPASPEVPAPRPPRLPARQQHSSTTISQQQPNQRPADSSVNESLRNLPAIMMHALCVIPFGSHFSK